MTTMHAHELHRGRIAPFDHLPPNDIIDQPAAEELNAQVAYRLSISLFVVEPPQTKKVQGLDGSQLSFVIGSPWIT